MLAPRLGGVAEGLEIGSIEAIDGLRSLGVEWIMGGGVTRAILIRDFQRSAGGDM